MEAKGLQREWQCGLKWKQKKNDYGLFLTLHPHRVMMNSGYQDVGSFYCL